MLFWAQGRARLRTTDNRSFVDEPQSTVNSIRSTYACPPGGFRSLPDAQDACGPLTALRLDVRRPAARLGSYAFLAATHGRAMAPSDMMDLQVPRCSPCGSPAAFVMAALSSWRSALPHQQTYAAFW